MRGLGKKPKVFIKCLNCGKVKRTYPCHVKSGKAKFCTKKCANIYNSKRGSDSPTWKGGMISRPCKICGESVKAYPSWIKAGQRIYCSKKCFAIGIKGLLAKENNPNWKGGKITKPCEVCGKEFYTRKNTSSSRFCSRKCLGRWNSKNRLGAQSAHWLGGITPGYIKVRNSKKYCDWRLLVFKRERFTCQKCGYKGKYIEAHHIKSFRELILLSLFSYPLLSLYDAAMAYAPLWNIDNGVTLCDKCHKSEHKRRE